MGHPDEVDEIFDAISYSKGASVIRMLHDYVGDEVCNTCTWDESCCMIKKGIVDEVGNYLQGCYISILKIKY